MLPGDALPSQFAGLPPGDLSLARGLLPRIALCYTDSIESKKHFRNGFKIRYFGAFVNGIVRYF